MVFVAFLFVITLFFPLIKLRLKETSISTIIGISASALLQLQQYQTNSSYPNEYYLGVAVLAGIAFLLSKYTKRLPSKISIKNDFKFVLPIALSIYLVFFILFWFFQPAFFQDKIYAVPVELYPILLGVMGIIGIAGFAFVLRAYRSEPVIIFPLLFLFIIVLGRALTYYNSNFENSGFWERRLIPYLFVSCSIVGSIAVFKVIDYLKQKNEVPRHLHMKRFNANLLSSTITSGIKVRNIVTNINMDILGVAFLSLLVLGGLLSTIFGLQALTFNTSRYGITDKETNLVSSLNKVDPYSTLLTFTQRSKSIADFSGVGQTGKVIGAFRNQIWPSQYPELPLNVLYTIDGSSLIYLSENDLKQISKDNSYLGSHVVRLAPALDNGGAS